MLKKQFNKKKKIKKYKEIQKNKVSMLFSQKKDYFHKYILNMFIVNFYNNIYINYIIH